MKKLFVSTICIVTLVGSIQNVSARSRVRNPILERTAKLGGACIGGLGAAGTFFFLKSGVFKNVEFSLGMFVPGCFMKGTVGVWFNKLSKGKAALGASVVGLIAGGLGWKILSRYTAEGYFVGALKIENGEECSQPEVLDIVKLHGGDVQLVADETIDFFAARENEQVKAVEAFASLFNELARADSFIDSALRGLDESTKKFAFIKQKEIKEMIKIIKSASLTIKATEEYKHQYGSVLEQRRIQAEKAKADAMIRAAHINAASVRF